MPYLMFGLKMLCCSAHGDIFQIYKVSVEIRNDLACFSLNMDYTENNSVSTKTQNSKIGLEYALYKKNLLNIHIFIVYTISCLPVFLFFFQFQLIDRPIVDTALSKDNQYPYLGISHLLYKCCLMIGRYMSHTSAIFSIGCL